MFHNDTLDNLQRDRENPWQYGQVSRERNHNKRLTFQRSRRSLLYFLRHEVSLAHTSQSSSLYASTFWQRKNTPATVYDGSLALF